MIKRELLAVLFCFIISSYSCREMIYDFVEMRMTKAQFKKNKKAKNFTDWLLFSRFKDIIKPVWFLPQILNIILCVTSVIMLFTGKAEYSVISLIYLTFIAVMLLYTEIIDYPTKEGKFRVRSKGRIITAAVFLVYVAYRIYKIFF